jgi:hypothetical protein
MAHLLFSAELQDICAFNCNISDVLCRPAELRTDTALRLRLQVQFESPFKTQKSPYFFFFCGLGI